MGSCPSYVVTVLPRDLGAELRPPLGGEKRAPCVGWTGTCPRFVWRLEAGVVFVPAVVGSVVLALALALAVAVAVVGAEVAVASWCVWGNGVSDARCTNCQRAVHFQGQCGRWIRGASGRYALGPLQELLLCPDCLWQWAQAMSLAAHPPAGPAHDLNALLMQLAASCSAGAGSAAAV